MSVLIRKAKLLDAKAITNLGARILPISYSLLEVTAFIGLSYNVLVCTIDDNIVGYLIADSKVHIMSFGIDQTYRRKGLGSALINGLFKCNEGKDITLYVHADNTTAITFYQNMGFKITEKMDNYYRGTLKDAITQDAYTMRYSADLK